MAYHILWRCDLLHHSCGRSVQAQKDSLSRSDQLCYVRKAAIGGRDALTFIAFAAFHPFRRTWLSTLGGLMARLPSQRQQMMLIARNRGIYLQLRQANLSLRACVQSRTRCPTSPQLTQLTLTWSGFSTGSSGHERVVWPNSV